MVKRIYIYLKEMFPITPNLIWSFSIFYGIYFVGMSMSGAQKLELSLNSILGAFTYFLINLFLRISDEFKDFEVDKAIFPHRPLPSGRVLASDLNIFRAVVLVAILVINTFVDKELLLFVILIIVVVLTTRYYFLPQYIAKSLFLQVATQSPLFLLENLYIISIFTSKSNMPLFTLPHLYAAIIFYLPFLIWEISRKIKAPQDENERQTYSQIWGYKIATMVPMVLSAVIYAMIFAVRTQLLLSNYFLIFWAAVLCIYFIPFIRFLFAPNSKSSSFRRFSEAFIVVMCISLVVELVLQRGILWTVFR